MSQALVVEDLSVTYLRPNLGSASPGEESGLFRRNRESVFAVRNVGLTVNRGEVVGVVGANGSGKTSLLSAIAQELPYDGVVLAPSRPRLVRMGRLLPNALSGRQTAELVIRSLRLPSNHEIDAPVRTFSKGMRSRLNFSVLTVGHPDVLLIDEALAVGDSSFVDRAAERVSRLATDGCAIVLVDHSASRLKRLCDRAILLRSGEVSERGHVGDVLDRYADRTTAAR